MSAEDLHRFLDRAVIQIDGPDATAFLQGLVTSDVALLKSQPAQLAGLLSPQGKVLFEFLIARSESGYLLDVAEAGAAGLIQRLKMYRLRSKVEIESAPRWSIFALWRPTVVLPQSGSGGMIFTDPRLHELGRRALLPDTIVGASQFNYDAHRISLGIPEGGKDYAFGTLFPHEAMFDQLNGVSFSKGCYVGQEIVARMQHRGTARSRFLMVTGDGPLPPMGTVVTAGAVPLGAMGSSMGTQGLALIRLDRLADAYAVKSPVTAGGVALTLAKPPYATFEAPTP